MVGLKSVYMSGYSCAVGYLARADLGFHTMAEMTTWAKSITSVIDVPVIADADDGYGNALLIMRTVEEFEKTGVAGIHLEDQRFPKRCGHLAGKYCLPMEESVAKLKAAIDARFDPDFVIMARTDAINAVGGSMEEAIERGKRYADVGADLVWPEFPTPDRRDAEVYAEAMQKDFPGLPMAFNSSSSFKWTEVDNPMTFKELGEIGYKFIFVTLGAIHAAMYGEWNFMKDLAENQGQAQMRHADPQERTPHREPPRYGQVRGLPGTGREVPPQGDGGGRLQQHQRLWSLRLQCQGGPVTTDVSPGGRPPTETEVSPILHTQGGVSNGNDGQG